MKTLDKFYKSIRYLGCVSILFMTPLGLILFSPNQLAAQELSVNVPATVTIKVNPLDAVSGRPVSVQIDIVRTKNQPVDVTSFVCNGTPLQVKLLREESKAPTELFSVEDQDILVVSTYATNLGMLPVGVQTFGPLQVTVGGIPIQSNVATFQVSSPVKSDRFQLQTSVRPSRVYIGQIVEFAYQILFYDPIQTTTEELPLFSLPQFQYEGSPVAETSLQGDATIQKITLKGRALSDGIVEVPRSLVEGFVRRDDPTTGVTLVPPLLQATSPEFSFTVQPLPANAPADFTGAFGAFVLRGRVLGNNEIRVGEPFTLEITASGRGDLSSLTLSKLLQSNQLKGAFSLSEKQASEIVDTTKRFLYECTLIDPDISIFPEITLYSFDPESGQYLAMRMPSIQLNVKLDEQAESRSKQDLGVSVRTREFVEPLQGSLERVSIPIYILLFTPIACGLVFALQKFFLNRREKNLKQEERSGYLLMLHALKQRLSPTKSLPMVKKALILRMRESGLITNQIDETSQLSSSGIVGEVKQVLEKIDQVLYEKNRKEITPEMFEEASRLFTKISRYTMDQREDETDL